MSSPAGLLAAAARLPDATDADLLQRVAAGRDDAAFAEVVRRYGRLVWRTCRLTAGPAAEDAFQATFLALAKRADSIRHAAALAGWLDRTARRAARKAKRRDRRPPPPEPAASADPLDRLTARELLQAIDEELARLPDRYRLPVLLCGVDGLSQDEAAARLGWSAGSLKGRLERGRAKLRQRLTARGLTVPAVLGAVAVPPELTAATLAAVAVPPELTAATLAAVRGGAVSDGVRTLVAEVTQMSVFTWLKPVAAVLAVGGAVTWTVVGGAEPPAVPKPTAARPVVAAKLVRWSAPLRTNLDDPTQPYATAGAWHPDGKHVVTAGNAGRATPDAKPVGEVRVWDAAAGKLVRTLTGAAETYANRAGMVAISPNGKYVAAVGRVSAAAGDKPSENVVQVWDWPDSRLPRGLTTRGGTLTAVAFSPDSQTVYALDMGGTVYAWGAAAGGEPVQWNPPQRSQVFGLTVTRKKHLVLTGPGTHGWWMIAAPPPVPTVISEMGIRNAAFLSAAVSAPDERFAVGGLAGPDQMAILLFPAPNMAYGVHPVGLATPPDVGLRPDPPLPDIGCVYQVAFSPDGTLIAAACQDKTVRLFASADHSKPHLKQLAVGREHTDFVYAVQFSPDGKSLLTVGRDAVKVWDVAELLKQTPKPDDWLTPEGAVKWELSRFAGSWELESAQFDEANRRIEARKVAKAMRVEFTVVKIDPTVTPKAVDIRFKGDVPADTTRLAVYDFPDADTCRICYTSTGEQRPTTVAAGPGSGQSLVVLKRMPLKK